MLEREGLRLGEDTLESLFEVLTIPLSRMVHRYWDLDDDCLLAMDHWNNWTRDHPGPGDFGDLVQVAARHCLARQHSKNPAPELGALPAYTRLGFTAEDQAELEREMDTNIGMMGPLLQG
jgi:HD-like signal output (HDOD) protein